MGGVRTVSNTLVGSTVDSPGSVFRTVSKGFDFEAFTIFLGHHPAGLALNTIGPVRSKDDLVSTHSTAFMFLIISTVKSSSSWTRNTFTSDGMRILVVTGSTESYFFDVIFVFTNSDVSSSTKTTLSKVSIHWAVS